MNSFDVKNVVLYMMKNILDADASVPSNITIVNSLNDEQATFPRIVFQELTISTNGRTLNYTDYTTNMMFQVDIFAKEPAADSMCRRIAKAVNTALERTIHLEKREGGNIVPVDSQSKRYTLTFAGTFNEETGTFN